jgi:hypothetical protein
MISPDFDTSHLNKEQKKIAGIIIKVMTKVMGEDFGGGGCKAFRTIEDHKARREDYGLESKLLLIHDGGDLASFCNPDYQYYKRTEALDTALNKAGYRLENCTCWYSAVYKN